MVGSKSIFAGAVSLAFLASQVAAHGTLEGLEINGKFVQGYSPNMLYDDNRPAVIGWDTPGSTDNGFVSARALQDPDIICHKGANPGQISATVQAGEEVAVVWTVWPDSHKGPVITYLASCNGSCTNVDKNELKFFKIHEEGLLDGKVFSGFWSSDVLLKNNSHMSIPIPANIAPGDYVMRHEIIALHEGQNEGGAQMYPQCVNINIEGSGSDLPDGVPGTDLYRINDPGIKFSIYQTMDSYPIPGPPMPAVFGGSGNSNGGGNGGGNGGDFGNDDGFDSDNESGNGNNGNGNGGGIGARVHDDENCDHGDQERKVRKRTFRRF